MREKWRVIVDRGYCQNILQLYNLYTDNTNLINVQLQNGSLWDMGLVHCCICATVINARDAPHHCRHMHIYVAAISLGNIISHRFIPISVTMWTLYWVFAARKGPLFLAQFPQPMVYFWLDFRSQGSNFGGSAAKGIFSANFGYFDLIPPFFFSKQMTNFGPNLTNFRVMQNCFKRG